MIGVTFGCILVTMFNLSCKKPNISLHQQSGKLTGTDVHSRTAMSVPPLAVAFYVATAVF